LKKLVN